MAVKSANLPLTGIAFRLTGTLFFTLMFACVRWLDNRYPTGEVVFARSFGALIPVVIAALYTGGWHLLGTTRLKQHAYRSFSGTASMFCNFLGVTMVPLATATAIGYASPLILVILAAAMLHEKVHAYRWSAVALGFLGVLVMIGPEAHFAGVDNLLGPALLLAGATFGAFALTFLRRMSGQEHSITIAFYFSATTAVFGLATIVFGWIVPTPLDAAVLLVSGLSGGLGQLALSYSYRYGEASVLAPFDYSTMLWAVIIGFILFGELPTAYVWAGSAIVIAAGLIIIWRERALRKQAVPAAPVQD